MFSADQIWNNLLKEIARQAYERGYLVADNGGDPNFSQWWAAFVEQNHTDG